MLCKGESGLEDNCACGVQHNLGLPCFRSACDGGTVKVANQQVVSSGMEIQSCMLIIWDLAKDPIQQSKRARVTCIVWDRAQASVRLSRLARQGTASFAAELSPLHDHLALTPVRLRHEPGVLRACCL